MFSTRQRTEQTRNIKYIFILNIVYLIRNIFKRIHLKPVFCKINSYFINIYIIIIFEKENGPMKKAVIMILVLVAVTSSIIGIINIKKKSPLDIAMKAELEGKYDIALQNFIAAVLKSTHSLEYPDKEKITVYSEIDWPSKVTQYLSWITYSLPFDNKDFQLAFEGVKRCSSYVTNNNFITKKKPEVLDQKEFSKIWKATFFRENDAATSHEKLINRAIKDSLCFLKIRAMNGYVYNSNLLDLHTGKITSFILYPNSTISLLVNPRKYFLICNSEARFVEGLSGKTWRSAENIIPFDFSQQNTLHMVTLKTRVNRKK